MNNVVELRPTKKISVTPDAYKFIEGHIKASDIETPQEWVDETIAQMLMMHTKDHEISEIIQHAYESKDKTACEQAIIILAKMCPRHTDCMQ